MALRIQRIINANFLLNSVSMLGTAEELQLPQIKAKQAEFKSLGMISPVDLYSGIDKMEMKIKWNSFYEDALVVMADFTKQLNIQVRASMDVYSGGERTEQRPVVAYLRGTCKNFPGGTFKQNDNVEAESDLTITYYKLEIGGSVLVEIDQLNNIYIVDGIDLLAQYRANLGI